MNWWALETLTKRDYDSVSLLYDTVPQRLQQYIREGWRVVVLTNQAGVALKLCTLTDMKVGVSSRTEG